MNATDTSTDERNRTWMRTFQITSVLLQLLGVRLIGDTILSLTKLSLVSKKSKQNAVKINNKCTNKIIVLDQLRTACGRFKHRTTGVQVTFLVAIEHVMTAELAKWTGTTKRNSPGKI